MALRHPVDWGAAASSRGYGNPCSLVCTAVAQTADVAGATGFRIAALGPSLDCTFAAWWVLAGRAPELILTQKGLCNVSRDQDSSSVISSPPAAAYVA